MMIFDTYDTGYKRFTFTRTIEKEGDCPVVLLAGYEARRAEGVTDKAVLKKSWKIENVDCHRTPS